MSSNSWKTKGHYGTAGMYGIHVFTGLDPPPSLPHRTAQLFSGRKKSFTEKRTFIFFLDFYINSDI
jgi:hypothetical protein